jgi:hypothetical protein
MHIQSALRGVKEEERCPNWKNGYNSPCGPVKPAEGLVGNTLGFLGMG